MRMPPAKFLVAGLLILAAITYLMFSGISDSMVYYYTISELEALGHELDGKGLRLAGHVRPGTIAYRQAGSAVDFEVYEKESGKTIGVSYEGIIPDTFKDDAEVVVAGAYLPQLRSFQANTLLAKCPSKYEELADEHPQDLQAETGQ